MDPTPKNLSIEQKTAPPSHQSQSKNTFPPSSPIFHTPNKRHQNKTGVSTSLPKNKNKESRKGKCQNAKQETEQQRVWEKKNKIFESYSYKRLKMLKT